MDQLWLSQSRIISKTHFLSFRPLSLLFAINKVGQQEKRAHGRTHPHTSPSPTMIYKRREPSLSELQGNLLGE